MRCKWGAGATDGQRTKKTDDGAGNFITSIRQTGQDNGGGLMGVVQRNTHFNWHSSFFDKDWGKCHLLNQHCPKSDICGATLFSVNCLINRNMLNNRYVSKILITFTCLFPPHYWHYLSSLASTSPTQPQSLKVSPNVQYTILGSSSTFSPLATSTPPWSPLPLLYISAKSTTHSTTIILLLMFVKTQRAPRCLARLAAPLSSRSPLMRFK